MPKAQIPRIVKGLWIRLRKVEYCLQARDGREPFFIRETPDQEPTGAFGEGS